jgi:hypothetical protein
VSPDPFPVEGLTLDQILDWIGGRKAAGWREDELRLMAGTLGEWVEYPGLKPGDPPRRVNKAEPGDRIFGVLVV